MKDYNMVFIFKKLEEEEELEILNKLLDMINADVYHYLGDSTLKFKVNILGKENRNVKFKKVTVTKDKFYAYVIMLDPMEYIRKPSKVNVNKLKKKMVRLASKICNEVNCKYAFIDDNLENLDSSDGLYVNSNRKYNGRIYV